MGHCFHSAWHSFYSAVDIITDDFAIALNVIGQGYRVVYEPAAYAVEMVVPDVKAEFRRKVRMIAGDIKLCGDTAYC